jgi:His/Glu/Gln/Arg/opine family amino acid ABC transporter permease subunit
MMLWDLLQPLLFGFPPPPEMIGSYYPDFFYRIGGLSLTVMITLPSLVIGALIGCMLAFLRRKPSHNLPFIPCFILRGISFAVTGFVEIVRGLPIMILTLLMFYLPFPLTGLRVPGAVLAIAAFSLYSGAYFSELIRSGFRTITSELREAGQVLGLSPVRIFLKIELPLVVRKMMPDIVNLAVTVFRDTSVLTVVGIAELTYTGRQMMMSQPENYGLILLMTMFLYWLPATLISSFLTTRSDGGSAFRKPFFRGFGKFISVGVLPKD